MGVYSSLKTSSAAVLFDNQGDYHSNQHKICRPKYAESGHVCLHTAIHLQARPARKYCDVDAELF